MSSFHFQVQDASIERAGRLLFQPVSFVLQAGQALHLQGDNGSGKTSLLRALCGLSTLSQGHARWGPAGVSDDQHAFKREVFYLGHALGMKDELSALENLQVACAIAGQTLSPSDAPSALQAQGLANRMHLPLRVLSQGQKRRVALARLQVSTARLWVLDEPWVALDQAAQSALTDLLTAHVTQGGLLLFTSHQAPALGHTVSELRLQP